MLIAIHNLLYFFLEKITLIVSVNPSVQSVQMAALAGRAATAGTVREFPIDRELQGPTITSLDGSLSQKTDALTLQFKTLSRDP